MPSDTSTLPPSQALTPMSLLEQDFRSKSKEEILNQAHDNIKFLEAHFDLAKHLVAITDRIKSHCGAGHGLCGFGLGFKDDFMLVQRTASILKLDRSVAECLFGDRAVDLAFARILDDGVSEECRSMIEDMTKLVTLISIFQDILPRDLQNEIEIVKSRPVEHPGDPQHADVPSLMASYDTSTDDEIRDKARGAIQALEDLLRRAKALALSSLPRLGSYIGIERPDNAICYMLESGGDLVLLRGYVDKLVRTKATVTSFTAGKFDRATSRLASRIKAQISTLEKFAAPGDARPSSVGEEKSWDLAGTIKQSREDIETVASLFKKIEDRLQIFAVQSNPGETGKALEGISLSDVLSRLAAMTILTVKVAEDVETHDGVRVDSLGRDFVGKVLEAAHDLVKADVSTLKRLTSDLEKIAGLSPAEAAARFPDVGSATDLIDSMMRKVFGQM